MGNGSSKLEKSLVLLSHVGCPYAIIPLASKNGTAFPWHAVPFSLDSNSLTRI